MSSFALVVTLFSPLACSLLYFGGMFTRIYYYDCIIQVYFLFVHSYSETCLSTQMKKFKKEQQSTTETSFFLLLYLILYFLQESDVDEKKDVHLIQHGLPYCFFSVVLEVVPGSPLNLIFLARCNVGGAASAVAVCG